MGVPGRKDEGVGGGEVKWFPVFIIRLTSMYNVCSTRERKRER